VVHKSRDSLILNQQMYATKILQHVDMMICKPVSTSLSISGKRGWGCLSCFACESLAI
jgi:hypothetical protein